jgi:hypothetical protein
LCSFFISILVLFKLANHVFVLRIFFRKQLIKDIEREFYKV